MKRLVMCVTLVAISSCAPEGDSDSGSDCGCADNEVCVDGACLTSCNRDSDCPEGEACSSGACAAPECGNGIVEGEEECDAATANADSGACTIACMVAICGDTLVHTGVEDCDDGNDDDQDVCTNACTNATCGDGSLWIGQEACDDGNPDPSDGCAADCTIEIGFCCIDGLDCLADGEPSPDNFCLICDVATSQTAWSGVSAGCNFGEACVTDADCDAGMCECATADCAARLCSGVECLCGFNGEGDSLCDGDLDAGTTPPAGCPGTCDGSGACYQQAGADCDLTQLCEPPLACVNGTCCQPGTCLEPGEACGANSACRSNECECSDATCTMTICSEADCGTCEFTSDGFGDCDGTIADGADDFDDSCGAAACTAGSCSAAGTPGAPCTTDAECDSSQCECGDATCSGPSTICSELDCPVCTFTSDGFGGCDGTIASGQDDADNSCGALTCNGLGSCYLALGSPCAMVGDCEGNLCECADATCATRHCAASDCFCEFADTSGSCGAGNLSAGVDGDDDCAGTLACNGAGACQVDIGGVCSIDNDCESDVCECDDADCSGDGRCAPFNCVCRYVDSSGTCETSYASGLDPDEDCAGPLACNGMGACQVDVGDDCNTDAECASDACECDNATCSGLRTCAQFDCLCTYVDASSGACGAGYITADTDPDNDCAGALSCDGAGACRQPDGAACITDSECASGVCECADATCSGPGICAASECICMYVNTSGACAWPFAAGTDPDSDCATPPDCDGSGMCG